jgi:MurNAc alpha-1-phosphate uridylyltransferase
MQAVVLAGGLATRLGARAKSTPKYLLEVAGQPFARWQLERIADAGFDQVVLCIGHLGDAIEEALGSQAFGLRLRYAREGDTLLGTGGALKRAEALLDDSFLLTYGDSYLPFDYAGPLHDLLAHDEALATMAVFENAGRFDRSNVAVEDERVAVYDKNAAAGDHDYIDYGAIALRRSALSRLPDGRSDLSPLQTELARDGVMRAYVASERFYEIGSEAGIADLERHLAGSA